MNVLEFISSLVSDFAWPLVVAGLAILFYKPLRQLMDGIARRSDDVTALRGGGFALELQTQIAEMSGTTADISLSLQSAEAIEQEHAMNVRSPHELVLDPVAAIYNAFERTRHRANDALEVIGGHRQPTMDEAMNEYKRIDGSVDEALAAVVKEMIQVRNALAVLETTQSSFSPKDRDYATRYVAVAARVQKHFEIRMESQAAAQ